MYNFIYGDISKIKKDPLKFLIFVKHLMPRFINSVPDNICISIYKNLNQLYKEKRKKLILLETGCGASSIAMFLFCALNGGKLFSWDTNPSKGSYLKSVINESICEPLKININDVWTFIGGSSVNPHTGISIIGELKLKADYCFLDSAHTINHLLMELNCVNKVSSKNFCISLDDAYTTETKYNYPFINMLRKKIGLKPIKKITKESETFLNKTVSFFKSKNRDIKILRNKFFSDDLYYKYYSSDYNFMKKVKLVKNPRKRFITFKIK